MNAIVFLSMKIQKLQEKNPHFPQKISSIDFFVLTGESF